MSGVELGSNLDTVFPLKQAGLIRKLQTTAKSVSDKYSEVTNNQSTNNYAGTLSAGTQHNLAESTSQPVCYKAPLIVHELPVCIVSSAVQVCQNRSEQQEGNEGRPFKHDKAL